MFVECNVTLHINEPNVERVLVKPYHISPRKVFIGIFTLFLSFCGYSIFTNEI